jgi:hypothetical protein
MRMMAAAVAAVLTALIALEDCSSLYVCKAAKVRAQGGAVLGDTC